MQFYLLYLHYSYSSIPKINADGIFGPATTAAVRAFQAKFGLTRDGVVGLATWTELYSIYSQKNALVLSDEQVPAYPGLRAAQGQPGPNRAGRADLPERHFARKYPSRR